MAIERTSFDGRFSLVVYARLTSYRKTPTRTLAPAGFTASCGKARGTVIATRMKRTTKRGFMIIRSATCSVGPRLFIVNEERAARLRNRSALLLCKHDRVAFRSGSGNKFLCVIQEGLEFGGPSFSGALLDQSDLVP